MPQGGGVPPEVMQRVQPIIDNLPYMIRSQVTPEAMSALYAQYQTDPQGAMATLQQLESAAQQPGLAQQILGAVQGAG